MDGLSGARRVHPSGYSGPSRWSALSTGAEANKHRKVARVKSEVERWRNTARAAADLEALAQVFMYSPEGSITDHHSKADQIEDLLKTRTRKLRLTKYLSYVSKRSIIQRTHKARLIAQRTMPFSLCSWKRRQLRRRERALLFRDLLFKDLLFKDLLVQRPAERARRVNSYSA